LRSKGPFISVNCAAIPETLFESLLFGTVKGAFTGAVETPGLFEQAEDGTIFFDEINSMPLFLQAKLLRVLQVKSIQRIGSTVQKPINCRIISATNNDPVEAIERKLIRSDLYFRLATITLNIPPLRERKEDINYLAASFIKKYNLKFGLFVDNIAEELLNLFDEYYWPGNVRELENFIEGAMNFVQDKDKTLNLHHLPEYFRKRILSNKKSPVNTIVSDKKLQSVLSETEKEMIESILAQNNRNITKTARELGISRQNLYYKFKILGIKK
jgi:arginine utilization regulatory protein